MKPNPDKVLLGVVAAISQHLSPELNSPFAHTTVGLSQSLLMILARESDGLIDRLINETNACAAIVRDALPLLDDTRRSEAQTAIADLSPADYRLSTIQGLNDRVRRALIDVHAAVEAQSSAEAMAMNDRIWQELMVSTLRRSGAAR